MNAVGGLPLKTLNGLLNGHQVFRIIWLLIFAAYGFVYWLVKDVSLLRQPLVLLGPTVLLLGFAVSERKYRERRLGGGGAPNVLVRIGSIRFKEYVDESNCRIQQKYPIAPFLFDFLGLGLLVASTGGIGSPFLPMLLFVGFVGSLAVYDRTLEMLMIPLLFTVGAVVVAAVAPDPVGWRATPREAFEVPNRMSLQFWVGLGIIMIFLYFSSKMTSSYAKDAFNLAPPETRKEESQNSSAT